MEDEYEEDPAPPELQDLTSELRKRFEYVVTLKRDEQDSLDMGGTLGFALVIGGDSDNALVIEASVSGDGGDAMATIWGVSDGQPADLNVLEYDRHYAMSVPLPPEGGT